MRYTFENARTRLSGTAEKRLLLNKAKAAAVRAIDRADARGLGCDTCKRARAKARSILTK